ncbi:MAG: MFS transporter [Actinobacteria bacterium]|nr:MFS transporter [Actinomycetota bacterium]
MRAAPVELGLRENLAQFSLLVAVTAFVGAMVGLERTALPLIGREDFGLASSAAVLSFIVAFGLAKSVTNLAAGTLADRSGRRRLLIVGWTLALPVPLLIGLAPSWEWVIAANALLGINQGLAWSMTVVMKIDLVGPRRRGFALGLNEAAGYGGVALAAALSGWLAAELGPREVLVWAGAVIAVAALLVSAAFVRDTGEHVALEQKAGSGAAGDEAPGLREAFGAASWRSRPLRSCSQAGLVNNLNDALAWGLVPLFLASEGAGLGQIGLIAGLYPAVWGIGQIWTGHWSDSVGRKPLIVAGMLLQAAALAALAASGGQLGAAAASAVLLGAGTALVYPTLIAAISDAVAPIARAATIGVYRFWRDIGYVVGALLAGGLADVLDFAGAIAVVAALTAASGLGVALDMPGKLRPATPAPEPRSGAQSAA